MACSLDFIEFVCQQIEAVGAIRYRKMFGDYMIYANEKTCHHSLRQHSLRKATRGY